MIPQVIKLSNGENIICTISESENSEQIKVNSPLKMDIFNIDKMTADYMRKSVLVRLILGLASMYVWKDTLF